MCSEGGDAASVGTDEKKEGGRERRRKRIKLVSKEIYTHNKTCFVLLSYVGIECDRYDASTPCLSTGTRWITTVSFARTMVASSRNSKRRREGKA